RAIYTSIWRIKNLVSNKRNGKSGTSNRVRSKREDLSDPYSSPKSDLGQNSRSHPGEHAQSNKPETQRREISKPAKKQRVGNNRRKNDQKQVSPRNIISEVNQACAGQRKFIGQSKSAAHTVECFKQMTYQAEKQGPAFHPPDCAEVIDNAGVDSR